MVLEVVVGAGIQAFHPVAQRVPRRKHHAGHSNSGMAQTPQQYEPIAIRQTAIDHERLVRQSPDRSPCRVDAIDDIDNDAGCLEPLANQSREPLMVLDQENSAHRVV